MRNTDSRALKLNIRPATGREMRTGFARFVNDPLALALGTLFCFFFLFYLWTGGASAPLVSKPLGFFNAQTDAYLHHQVALVKGPSKALLALPDPYDPRQNASLRMHDALLYHGHYYMYWGVAPVLLLYLPVRLVTGRFIADALAVPLFASAGLLFYLLLLYNIRSDYFRNSSPWILVALALLLGFGNMAPFILRRPAVYEVAITCGYFSTALFFFLAYQAAFRANLKLKFLIAASFALGLVFLSRPNLAACGLVLAAGTYLYKRFEPSLRLSTLVAFAGLPVAACVAAQGIYNFVRFGSFTNYGIVYQLAAIKVSDVPVFSLTRAFFSTIYFLFASPSFSASFPFVRPGAGPDSLAPPFRWALDALSGFVPYTSVEYTVGILMGVPALLLLILAPSFLYLYPDFKLRLFFFAALAGTALTSIATAGIGPTMRYELDFLPQLLLLTSILFWWILQNVTRKTGRIIGVAFMVCISYTVVVSAALGMTGYNDNFRAQYPSQYARVASWFGPVEGLLVRQQHYPGTMRASVFPPVCRADGLGQPLLTSGATGAGDFIFIACTRSSGSYAIGWNHWGRPTTVGPTFALPARAKMDVQVRAPFLYAPAAGGGHALRSCTVLINGRPVFQRADCDTYDSAPSRVFVLSNPLGGTVDTDSYTSAPHP